MYRTNWTGGTILSEFMNHNKNIDGEIILGDCTHVRRPKWKSGLDWIYVADYVDVGAVLYMLNLAVIQ